MAGGRNVVRDTGGAKLRQFRRRFSKGETVLVGIQGKEAEEQHTLTAPEGEPETVGEIASRHELGLGVPERSWLRMWVDENRSMIQEDLRSGMRRVLLGQLTMDQVVDILGVKYVGLIQANIAEGIEPPNAPSTIARKGSSTPLIDTGQMRSAITHVLESDLRAEAAGQ